MPQKWPSYVWIVRHGESAGNVARLAAEAAELPVVDIATRDCDVPLSELGERQADALGSWFARLPEQRRPTVILSSPYERAKETALRIRAVLAADGADAPDLITDERLREREFGILDRLTKIGVAMHLPQQAELRKLLGKFYHRPPGGESWADVILRLRSVLNTINLLYADRRVVIVCHQVVVLCMRYILEELDEAQILAIDKQAEVLNCGICAYEFERRDDELCVPKLVLWNHGAPLEKGEPQTAEPDEMTGTR